MCLTLCLLTTERNKIGLHLLSRNGDSSTLVFQNTVKVQILLSFCVQTNVDKFSLEKFGPVYSESSPLVAVLFSALVSSTYLPAMSQESAIILQLNNVFLSDVLYWVQGSDKNSCFLKWQLFLTHSFSAFFRFIPQSCFLHVIPEDLLYFPCKVTLLDSLSEGKVVSLTFSYHLLPKTDSFCSPFLCYLSLIPKQRFRCNFKVILTGSVETPVSPLLEKTNTPSHSISIQSPRIGILLGVCPSQQELCKIVLKQTFYKFPLKENEVSLFPQCLIYARKIFQSPPTPKLIMGPPVVGVSATHLSLSLLSLSAESQVEVEKSDIKNSHMYLAMPKSVSKAPAYLDNNYSFLILAVHCSNRKLGAELRCVPRGTQLAAFQNNDKITFTLSADLQTMALV